MLTLILIVALQASPLGDDGVTLSNGGRTATFSGQINGDTVDSLSRAFEQGADHLVITSPGGHLDAGVRLGELVLQHHVDVEVEGYCLSACASFAFVAAETRFVRPGAVVGFHKTSSAYERMAVEHNIAGLAERVRDRADRERRLYEARGVSLELLYDPFVATMPSCYRVDVTEGRDLVSTWARASFWYPDANYLRGVGIDEVPENWADSHADTAGRLGRLGLRFARSFTFGGVITTEAATAGYRDLHTC